LGISRIILSHVLLTVMFQVARLDSSIICTHHRVFNQIELSTKALLVKACLIILAPEENELIAIWLVKLLKYDIKRSTRYGHWSVYGLEWLSSHFTNSLNSLYLIDYL
jgi:hypothetical protein